MAQLVPGVAPTHQGVSEVLQLLQTPTGGTAAATSTLHGGMQARLKQGVLYLELTSHAAEMGNVNSGEQLGLPCARLAITSKVPMHHDARLLHC